MVGKEEFIDAYELLGIQIEASEAEVKRAYRQRSLKVHPDRHPNNPDAAAKFHELNQAYELLLDPSRRSALDVVIQTKLAHKARVKKFDVKRKGLQEELEEAERAAKRFKEDKAKQAREVQQETERIMEEGRRMRLQKEEGLRRNEERKEKESTITENTYTLGSLDTTIRIKYSLIKYPDLVTPSSLKSLLARFGPVDESSIVLFMKPPKKAPTKPPKFASALVPFEKIGDAHAAVCSSGLESKGLKDIEISWAGGKEPEILETLKQKRSVETTSFIHSSNEATSPPPIFSFEPSFSFDSMEAQEQIYKAPSTELDFESITLMRLRQAERERLEREILEQEAEQ
ncbi:hypothetical protein Clacol_009204 [Clathrus columnatus]|uniref:J domain-containing protein n=1 Tax=Clathrus columnatus TaxID=1419009 RepID=A0AAV5AQE9_9AGAM|nr:hypothetical protein Clacol_009204 [Clathrus columnatus]